MRSGPRTARRAAAFAVHALTASGAVFGLLALRAACGGQPRAALGWLGVALVIDGVDGALARRARVGEFAPEIDGELLDNLIDYLNYAVVPALVIADSLPGAAALAAAAWICTSAAFQFAHHEAKRDAAFRGFPSCWNVAAAYVLLLDLDAAATSAWVAGLGALAFVPIRFVYPSRTRAFRRTTLLALVLWLAALAWAVALHPAAPRALVHSSLAFPLYYLALSLWLTARPARA